MYPSFCIRAGRMQPISRQLHGEWDMLLFVAVSSMYGAAIAGVLPVRNELLVVVKRRCDASEAVPSVEPLRFRGGRGPFSPAKGQNQIPGSLEDPSGRYFPSFFPSFVHAPPAPPTALACLRLKATVVELRA